ncbi:MAG: hypothetical protein LUE11_06375 [Clostridia bacterium]|nr:hypothetical protein [Clostridia bacterium]
MAKEMFWCAPAHRRHAGQNGPPACPLKVYETKGGELDCRNVFLYKKKSLAKEMSGAFLRTAGMPDKMVRQPAR